jgi:DNA-binding CsgD family transcriptional regulator
VGFFYGHSIFGNYYPKTPQLVPTCKICKYLSYRHLTQPMKEHAMTTHLSANIDQLFTPPLPSKVYGFGLTGAAKAPSQPSPADSLVASALDELASGVVVIDLQGRVLHRNLAADAIIARGDCVTIVADTITAAHGHNVRLFSEALSKAAAGKRSMITLGGTTSLIVVPLRGGAPGEQRLALMFSRMGVCEALTLSFFSRAHCLTASEEKILGLMSGGLTAPEMAQQLKIGESTVRSHVRNICSKTRCNGIREVVNRLAVLPPLMSALGLPA